jgi:hypothetical protein
MPDPIAPVSGHTRRAALSLLLCGVLAACTIGTGPAGSTRIQTGDAAAAGSFNTGGGIMLRAGLREVGGELAVCGAWSRDRQSGLSHFLNDDVLSSGIVFAGGDRLVQNLTFMTEVTTTDAMPDAGALAACVGTGRAWTLEDATRAVSIRLPQRRFTDECDEDGCMPVVFRQTLMTR